MISVIIPTYNCAKYLLYAIESVFNQTYKNTEIIVINDGSTDNTDEVIEPYRDKIKYIKQKNKGLSSSRNLGFRSCHGEYICFLDADDILINDKFEKQLNVFHENLDIGIVISGFTFIDEDGISEIQNVYKHWNRDGIIRLLNHEVFPPHAALVQRDLLEKSSLFPEDIETTESQEDWQLWLELALKGAQFISIPEPTCKYRIRKGSIRSDRLKHLDGARRVISWLRNNPLADPYKKQVDHLETIIEMERVGAAFLSVDNKLCKSILLNSISKWPLFWQDPMTYRRLFERILEPYQSVEWIIKPNPEIFKRNIIDGILRSIKGEIPSHEFNRLCSAAYLVLSDIFYSKNATTQLTIIKAMFTSPVVCFSKNGISSTIRGILGPGIGKFASRLSNS